MQETLSMYRAPSSGANGEVRYGEHRSFYAIGNGLNAVAGKMHGGVLATLLDSAMGQLINKQMPGQLDLFTVQLNVAYKNPVSTPGTILTRSWITKVEGRKIRVSAMVEGENGVVHATAEGIWLRGKANL